MISPYLLGFIVIVFPLEIKRREAYQDYLFGSVKVTLLSSKCNKTVGGLMDRFRFARFYPSL